MFEQNKAIPAAYRYDVAWLSQPGLGGILISWMSRLNGISAFSQMAHHLQGSHVHRRKLVKEFYGVMFCYAYFLDERIEYFERHRKDTRHDTLATLRNESVRINTAIRNLESHYQSVFRESLLSSQMEAITHLVQLADTADRLAGPNTQLAGIERKRQLVQSWLDDLRYGTSQMDVGVTAAGTTDENALFLAYLGNAETEKVRLVLDVLLKDAAEMLKNPSNFTTAVGPAAGAKVEWSYEEFKTTVKAEAGAFAGARVDGQYEIEVSNLKAVFKSSALAGAQLAGEIGGSWGRDGLALNAEVEALVGVKITFAAQLEIGDIFLLEASAEAFAGALARAKVELSATVGGVKFSIGAEAFAGARITGSAAVGFKAFGATILTGQVTGSLTAGVGAKFNFEFEATGAGGSKLGFEAGLTLGVGAEGRAALEFNTWNATLAVGALYYTAYSCAVYSSKESRMRREYLLGLNSNEKLFTWTLERLAQYKQQAQFNHDTAAARDREMAQVKALADAIWMPRSDQGPLLR